MGSRSRRGVSGSGASEQTNGAQSRTFIDAEHEHCGMNTTLPSLVNGERNESGNASGGGGGGGNSGDIVCVRPPYTGSNTSNTFKSRFLIKPDDEVIDDDDDDDEEEEDNSAVNNLLADEGQLSLVLKTNRSLYEGTDLDDLEGDDSVYPQMIGIPLLTRPMTKKQRKEQQRLRRVRGVPDFGGKPLEYQHMLVDTRLVFNSDQSLDLMGVGGLTPCVLSSGQGGAGSFNVKDHSTRMISNGGVIATSSSTPMVDDARMVCIARRLPNNGKSDLKITQFNTKIDLNGRVTKVDTTNAPENYANYLQSVLPGKLIQEFVHPDELVQVQAHLRDAIKNKTLCTPVNYRFKVSVGYFPSNTFLLTPFYSSTAWF